MKLVESLNLDMFVPAEMLSFVHNDMIGCSIASKSVSRSPLSSACCSTTSHWAFSTASSICFCCCCINTLKSKRTLTCNLAICSDKMINYSMLCRQILFRLSNLIAKYILLGHNVINLSRNIHHIQIWDSWHRCWWLLRLHTRYRHNIIPIISNVVLYLKHLWWNLWQHLSDGWLLL